MHFKCFTLAPHRLNAFHAHQRFLEESQKQFATCVLQYSSRTILEQYGEPMEQK